jgi:hypothetical protein
VTRSHSLKDMRYNFLHLVTARVYEDRFSRTVTPWDKTDSPSSPSPSSSTSSSASSTLEGVTSSARSWSLTTSLLCLGGEWEISPTEDSSSKGSTVAIKIIVTMLENRTSFNMLDKGKSKGKGRLRGIVQELRWLMGGVMMVIRRQGAQMSRGEVNLEAKRIL